MTRRSAAAAVSPRSSLVLALAALLAAPAAARAAHPLVTDDTGTQGKGNYQLELTGELGRDRESAGGVRVHESAGELAATLSIGVHDAVDLVVAAPQAWSRVRENGSMVAETSGFGDLAVELKCRVLERGGFSFAVKPGLALPTGSAREGLGNGRVSYGATLVATQEVGRFAFHLNGGWSRNEYELAEDRASNRADVFHASAAIAAEVVAGLVLAANVGLETSSDRATSTPPAHVVGGAIWSISESFDVDLGVKAGLNAPEADLVGLGGIAWRF